MVGTLLNLLMKWIPGLLPRLIIERPDLLIDHALAYAALAQREAESVKQHWVRKIVAGAVALASALSFVMLSGVAMMMYAVTQFRVDATWVLIAVPGAMLVITIVASMVALSKGKPRTESLGDQVRIDLKAIRSGIGSRSTSSLNSQ